MAKKKKRKKELRRRQKLDIKIISEQDGEVFEQLLSQQPIFVERRQIQYFDDEKEALFAYAESQGRNVGEIEPEDIERVRELMALGKVPFPKETRLFRQAMYTPDDRKRSNLLKQVLDLKPDHFLAQFHLLLTEEDPFDLTYFEKIWQFYGKTKKGWKDKDYLGWEYWESRPYLTALNYIVTYLHGQGFLGLACEVVDFVLSKRPKRFAPDFLHLAMSVYNELGRWERVENLYHRYANELPQYKDSLLFHYLISKLLQGQITEAEKIFVALTEVNEEATDYFATADWLEDLLDIEESEIYVPFSTQSLAATACHLQDFFERNPLVLEFLYRFARECGGKSEYGEILDFFATYRSPLFAGLRFDIFRTLFHENLRVVEDFQNITEKELLAIKGIGKKTVDKLKENGVIFKER